MSKEDKQGYILFFIAISIIVIVIYSIFNLKRNSQHDPLTLCPLNISYDSTVIIIDKSDPWKRNDSLKIKKILTRTFSNLDTYERLIIKVIEPDEAGDTEVKTYFDMCNPGNKANPLYQNPKKILKKYNTFFETPLKKVMTSLTSSSVTQTSPILEAIQESIAYSQGEKIKLVVVSDLLQYTTDFNFYKSIPSTKDVIDTLSLNEHKLQSLHIEYILRKHKKNKIRASLKFFKNLTNQLNAKFSKRKLLICK